jgi:CopG family nickel-responsive transcriptional regulator
MSVINLHFRCEIMAIVTISLNDAMLKEVDKVRSEMGFSGRSEVIRAGLRILLAENKEKEELTDRVRGVLLLIHEHDAEDLVTNVKHDFLDIIYTQLHNRFKEGKCLELFVLDGEAGRIRELKSIFQKNDRIEYVKLIVA